MLEQIFTQEKRFRGNTPQCVYFNESRSFENSDPMVEGEIPAQFLQLRVLRPFCLSDDFLIQFSFEVVATL
jgi:hypothetical protein